MLVGTVQPTWRTVALTTTAAVVTMVVLSIAVERADAHYAWSDEAAHATGHGAFVVPLLLLIVAAVRLWPAPRPTLASRRARMLIVTGMATITLGQCLEALGAFAYDGDERAWPTLAAVHDVGLIIGPFGMLVISSGVALALHRRSAGVGAADIAILGVGVVGIAGLFIGLPLPVGVVLIVGASAVALTRRRLSRAPNA